MSDHQWIGCVSVSRRFNKNRLVTSSLSAQINHNTQTHIPQRIPPLHVGIGGYYVMWDTAEINYSILWANLAGSILMGFVTRHSSYLKQSPSRFLRCMYPILTTGLCGSITTFSSWSFECNKSFFLQWQGKETMPSLRGGRLIEWIVSMW